MTIVFAIIMICILIFIHELGHFIAAKACGVKVNEFALGMGPAIIKRQRGETLYSLRIIPIGGYCAMEGEDESIFLEAGAGLNVIIAIGLLIIVTYFIGFPTSTIGNVQEDSPAQAAGIVAGDVILEADGTVVDDWYDFTDIVEKHDNGEPLQLVVERDGSEVEVYATPEKGEDGRYIIGVGTQMERSAFKSIVKGPEATWDMTKNMYTVIKQLITGEVSTKDLAGPVGIVYMVDQSVSQGFMTFIYFTAMMSLNLAVVNLLPFPALDGGRLIFVVIRKITGKAITDNMEATVHLIGMVLLMLLMVYVTWQDILRFVLPIFK